MRVLIVEDQPRGAQSIRRRLEEDGHTVEVAGNARAATGRLGQDPRPDLVILDLMLATGDGFAVLETLRQRSGAPVLALSARDRVADKVKALDLGADDYLVTPFDPEEFLARVRALSRRSAGLHLP
jgi:DNA-binding response OmpR family regulator